MAREDVNRLPITVGKNLVIGVSAGVAATLYQDGGTIRLAVFLLPCTSCSWACSSPRNSCGGSSWPTLPTRPTRRPRTPQHADYVAPAAGRRRGRAATRYVRRRSGSRYTASPKITYGGKMSPSAATTSRAPTGSLPTDNCRTLHHHHHHHAHLLSNSLTRPLCASMYPQSPAYVGVDPRVAAKNKYLYHPRTWARISHRQTDDYEQQAIEG